MGAWGCRIFEDDTSLDALDELIESESLKENIAKCLNNVISSESEYIDYDDGMYALAAAAIVDAAANGIDYTLLAETEDAVKSLEIDKVCDDSLAVFKNDALKAIEAVLGDNSEIRELWEENEELYPLWRENINKIKERLNGDSKK